MNVVERKAPPLARNVSRLGHLDLPGAGQVTVSGSHAYVGHIPNKDHLGTSIVDISDPRHPRTVATITLDDHDSHSHKVRVVGDIMIVNHERNPTAIGRRADELPRVRRDLTQPFIDRDRQIGRCDLDGGAQQHAIERPGTETAADTENSERHRTSLARARAFGDAPRSRGRVA